MIPNLDQLLLVCGLVSVIVFGIVYVLVNLMKHVQTDDTEDN
jgi:hypothetical protein